MAKKITAIILSAVLLISAFSVTALGFSFPEPDWGALFYEKQDMINETDFELYVEGPADSAPYFGAKLEPTNGAYIGSVTGTSEKLRPISSFLTYVEGMDQTDFYHPDKAIIPEHNTVTMVGWTIYNINTVNYDTVRQTLDTLSTYNKPMFIRFANEMNVSDLGNDPNKYVEVFRKVADMVHEYPNFAVVWSPCDLGALDRPYEYFYPGDEYVDWVGVSCYMLQYFMGVKGNDVKYETYFMTAGNAWATNKLKPIIKFMEENNIKKPVMISEGGVSTNNKYGEDCQEWATPRLRNMLWAVLMKYPQVKMINYFDVFRGNEAERYNISDYPYAVDIFNEAKTSGAYIPEYGVSAEFAFAKADAGHTLKAKDGVVNLYTLAHAPQQPDIDVHYYLDGEWYSVSKNIPYKCCLDISKLSDGAHTMKIVSPAGNKEYTFYKAGKAIRFGAMPEVTEEEPAKEEPIKITLNGAPIKFDVAPVIIDGRTLVPMRAIFEALGADVTWNAETRTASGKRDSLTVSFTIDKPQITIGGEKKELDVPAQLVSDRTMIPARAVAEAFGCKVDWNAKTRTVIIEE